MKNLTVENVLEIAREFSNFNEFRIKARSAYLSSLKFKIIDQILQIYVNTSSLQTSNVAINIKPVFKKKKKTKSLKKIENNEQIGLSSEEYKMSYLSHMKSMRLKNKLEKEKRGIEIHNERLVEKKKRLESEFLLKEIAKKYETRIEFAVKSNLEYLKCYGLGIIDEACKHMKPNDKSILATLRPPQNKT